MPTLISNISLNNQLGGVVNSVASSPGVSSAVVASQPVQTTAAIVQEKEKLSKETNFQIESKLGFDRKSKNYINSEPTMLFVAEYIIDGTNHGALLVFERFFESTHYEIFKRNLFSEKSDFERVLFIDSKNLEKETKNYISYINDVLGFLAREDEIFIYHDDEIKDDRIYEYKVKAAFVPRSAEEVDYDSVLQSKDLLSVIDIDKTSSASVRSFAAFSLGTQELAWIICLLNEELKLFFAKNQNIPVAERTDQVFILKDINDLFLVINDSVQMFGLKNTFNRIIDTVGTISVKTFILDSINEDESSFSFDVFRELIQKQYPILSVLLSASDELSALLVQEINGLPFASFLHKSGSINLNGLTSYTEVLNHIRDSITLILFVQENSEKINELKARLEAEDTAEQAFIEEIEKQITEVGSVDVPPGYTANYSYGQNGELTVTLIAPDGTITTVTAAPPGVSSDSELTQPSTTGTFIRV